MALYKITDEQVQNNGVVSAPDKLTGTAAQNKAIFDKLVREVVKVQLNNLVDALMAYTGADEIGAKVEGLEGDTIQKVMVSLNAKQDEDAQALEAAKTELQAAINNRYTKEEINAIVQQAAEEVGQEIAAQTDSLVESISYSEGYYGGVLTVTQKDGTTRELYISNITNVASTETIGMSVGNGGVVTSYVKEGSISVDRLSTAVKNTINGKQDALVSGTNIKTINGNSLLGSGNIVIEAGGDADKVKFNNDLTTTFEIGNIKLENGQAVIPAAGKTLTEVWNEIFVEEKNPTVTAPKVTLTAPECKAYEVGQKVSPTYTAELSAGLYEFGPATGITATGWAVTNTKTTTTGTNINNEVVERQNKAAGTFGEVTVEDDTTYVITATANHGAGAVPVTNLGNAYAAGAIPAGTKKATSTAISGYRNGFYGTANNKTDAVDSAFVRALPKKSGKAPAAGNVWELPVPVGAMRIAFAYPATLRDVSSVTDVNGMNAEIKTAFTKQTVSVKGSNGYTAINYKVYVLDRAEPVTEANTYKVTI